MEHYCLGRHDNKTLIICSISFWSKQPFAKVVVDIHENILPLILTDTVVKVNSGFQLNINILHIKI